MITMTSARAVALFSLFFVSLVGCGDRSVAPADSGPAADSPPPSGCKTSAQCGKGMYCHLASGCPGPLVPGTCKATPIGCNTMYAPVCGCDGKQYGNACGAQVAGTNTAYPGTCGDCTAIQSAHAKARERARKCTGQCTTKVSVAAGNCCEIFVDPAQVGPIIELELLDKAWRDNVCPSPPCGIPCPEPPPATCSGGLCSLPPAP
jgi:hypothetical protein